MLDVPEEQVRGADPQDMLGRALTLPDQFARAVEHARAIRFAPAREVKRVLVTGLGGSAMGGDLIAAWADREGKAPVAVNRTYDVPRWVDKDTLVVAVSFSGNTEETLASFVEARHRGAMVAGIATGGKLEEFCAKTKTPFVKIEGGIQPRAALPRTFVPQAALLSLAGVLPEPWSAFREASDAMASFGDDLTPSASPPRNVAKRIALALQDSVPVLYGAGALAPVTRRWANQLNENSKVLAFHGVMPEMTHNEIVGWSADDDLDRFTALFLRHEAEHAQNKQRFEFLGKLIQERGGRLVQVESPGKHEIAATMSSIFVGDVASVYLAGLRNQDPTQVAVITKLKDHVGESGFAKGLESRL